MNKFSYIELAILQMLEAKELHGYAMSAKMKSYSEGGLNLPAGSLYPALHKLERSGLIESNLDLDDGRKRRVYKLTTRGVDVLIHEIKSWKIIVKTMNAIMGVV